MAYDFFMFIDAEHKVQRLLWAAGIQCPQPVLDVSGREKSLQRIGAGTESTAKGESEGRNINTGTVY